MSNRVVAIVKEHPAGAAIGAVGIIVLFLLMKGGGGGGSSSGMAAYYSALQAQTAAGNAIQMEKLQLDAATQQETIAAGYALETAKLKSADNRYGIDSNERISDLQVTTQHAIADNVVNLENSQLHSNEILADIQGRYNVSAIKASKHRSFLDQISGVIGSLGGGAGIGALLGI